MIRTVHIKNYKCLRDVQVELSPLTVLVGANASGKTAVLEALRWEVGHIGRTVWRRQKSLALEIRLISDTGKEAVLTWQDGNSHPSRQGSRRDAQFLRLELESLREDNRPKAEKNLRLLPGGGNLTNLFATLGRKEQAALAEQLGHLVPQYRDVVTRPAAQEGYLRLELQDRWQDDLWYLTSEVSDGTILTLAFLILQHQKPVPDLLAIEEPERGLHPYLLEQLVALARGLSTGAFGGKPIQVVMATHSAELLEHLQPSEVRFLRRTGEEGETVVETAPSESPEWERAFDEYKRSLGGAWLSGGLGGVPVSA